MKSKEQEWRESKIKGVCVTPDGSISKNGVVIKPYARKYKRNNDSNYGFRMRYDGHNIWVNLAKTVYETFVKDIKEDEILIYKDDDKSNCKLSNLKVVTKKYLHQQIVRKNWLAKTQKKNEELMARDEFLKYGWKLTEYDNLWVHSDGKFYRSGRFLKPQKFCHTKDSSNHTLYISFTKSDGKKIKLIAGVVIYETFKSKLAENEYVIHIDGDKENLKLDNLRTGSAFEFYCKAYEKRRVKHVDEAKYMEELMVLHKEIHLAIDYAVTGDMKNYNEYITTSVIPKLKEYGLRRFRLSVDKIDELIRLVVSDIYVAIAERSYTILLFPAKKKMLYYMKKRRPSLRYKRRERPELNLSERGFLIQENLRVFNENVLL